MTSNIVVKKEGESSWVTYIKRRIKNNLNFLAIATGSTGIGKSWAMLSLANKIDPEFECRQVAFSFQQVMDIIDADWFKEKKYKIILFDEPQVTISNRQWQSLTNKLFNYLLSTFRHQNIILFFATPYADFIDSQTMKLIHCVFEIRSHSKKKQTTRIRPKFLQYNSSMKKFYYHSLYSVKEKHNAKAIVFWNIMKPPKELIKPYEEVKVEFTSKLNKNIVTELYELKNGDRIDKRKPMTKKQKNVFKLYKKIGDAQKIAKKIGVHSSVVYRQLESIRNKGYTLENTDFGTI